MNIDQEFIIYKQALCWELSIAGIDVIYMPGQNKTK